jgi:S1-C subfamily serine protease
VLGGVATLAITGGGGDDGAAPATTAEVTTTVAQTTTTAATTTVATTVPETTAPATTSPPPVSMDELATSVVQILGRDAAGGPLCSGSGSIISADGLILTNAHVVENEGECAYESLAVALTEDPALAPVPTYLGEVVAFDPGLDLAVVRVATDLEGTAVSPSFEPIPIGDSDAVGLGDRIRILGYPGIGGDTITFTQGSVSGFTAESGVADRAWIKTDATIAGGNSGGTAVNDAGELVGVPTRAGPGGDVFADCRVVEDTNGDNVIDENDSCIPIGGFINGLRPVNLALPLIEQAKSGEPVDPVQDQVDIDLDLVRMTPPVFATEVGPDDAPVDVAEVVPVGTPQICGFWDYEGMVDGVVWDAIWSVDGTYDEGFSILGGQWTGGTDGVHWWVCAIGGDGGLQAGEYELSVYVADELIVSNTVFVGEYPVVDVTFDNQTGVDVCFLRLSPQTASNWGPDELDSDTVITAGTSVTLSEVGAVYDLLAETCDLEPVVQQFGVDLTAGGTVTLTP